MSQIIRITILLENTACGHGMLAEHGIAFRIDTGDNHLLFDTGQGLLHVLANNAEKLQLPLDEVDTIVLSHGHYDHTGGLEYVLAQTKNPALYVHPFAFQPKYAYDKDGNTIRYIGMPYADEEAIRSQTKKLIWTQKPTEICKGLFVTGQVPRNTEFEDTGGPFFLDKKLQQPDLLLDDQAIFFESSQGTVVLLGCAHAGVINTLRYIKQLTENRPIHTVVGGMHLGSASRERMNRSIDAFRELEVERLGPAHCTGLKATADLWAAFPGQCFPCQVGTRLTFEME